MIVKIRPFSAEQAEQLVLNTSQGQSEGTSCYASNEDDDDDDDDDNDLNDDDDNDVNDEEEEETTREEVRPRDPLSNLSSQKLRRKLQHLNFNQVNIGIKFCKSLFKSPRKFLRLDDKGWNCK